MAATPDTLHYFEQQRLFRLEIRQGITVIIKPSGQRITQKYHKFPDIGYIGRLMILHEDRRDSFSHYLNLAGSMPHDKQGVFLHNLNIPIWIMIVPSPTCFISIKTVRVPAELMILSSLFSRTPR